MSEPQFLSGPDRVRDYHRIAFIYGSNDLNGAENCLETLLQTFVIAGCKRLEVKIHSDSSLTVVSYDRGIYLGEVSDLTGSTWRNLFCNLYNEPPNYLSQMYGGIRPAPVPVHSVISPLTAVQYACSRFEVESIRGDGYRYLISFEKGYPTGELVRFPTKDIPHTKIHLKFDCFGEIQFTPEGIRRILNCLQDYLSLIHI